MARGGTETVLIIATLIAAALAVFAAGYGITGCVIGVLPGCRP